MSFGALGSLRPAAVLIALLAGCADGGVASSPGDAGAPELDDAGAPADAGAVLPGAACTPHQRGCYDAVTPTVCSAAGTWELVAGCGATQPACVGGACLSCFPGALACEGATPLHCGVAGTWEPGAACVGATPRCIGGVCSPGNDACAGLAPGCGPSRDQDCCAAGVVPGGLFHRSNAANLPASVSPFRLDRYEITVGRFRSFLEAGGGTRLHPPTSGEGAHPRVGIGWSSTWNESLAADRAALDDALGCGPLATWTPEPGGNEAKPINCLTWYEAFAFCAWSGGRLPTDLEWSFAAAGGEEQRDRPWGEGGGCGSANYNCVPGAHCTNSPEEVGTHSPQGDGRYGHSDLGGNVQEWVYDPPGANPIPCNDCVRPGRATAPWDRLVRGGHYCSGAQDLSIAHPLEVPASSRSDVQGARCAYSD